MIRVKIYGGLGNQLFQYAYAFYLAERFHDEITLYPDESRKIYRKYKLDALKLSYKKSLHTKPFLVSLYENKIINKLLRMCGIRRLQYGHRKVYLLQKKAYDSLNFFSDDMFIGDAYIHGYWFALDMPVETEEKLIKMITPNFDLSKEYQALEKEIKACNSVSVHIRRGDYIKYRPNRILKDEYYYFTRKLLEKQYSNLKFFFFSDDIDYVKKTYSDFGNAEYVNFNSTNSDIEEMILMSKCKINIICDSTFSIWGGRLNRNPDRKIIAPEGCWRYKFPKKNWVLLKNAYVNDVGKVEILDI